MPKNHEISQKDLQSAFSVFRETVNAIHPLSEDDFERLEHVFHYRKYSKGEVILEKGKVCRRLWFILKGGFRMFTVEKGVDVNLHFFLERDFAADFVSLRHQIPSNFSIVALEDTETLFSYKTAYHPIIDFTHSMVKFTAEFFAKHFLAEVEHSNMFKMMTPEERYKDLVLNKPDYIQRIPLSYLASYLGISRKTITRIRQGMK